MWVIRLWLIVLFGLSACAADQAQGPRSPEAVVREYQAFVDQNQFEQAQALSTPAERQRLQDLAEMIENFDSTVFHTEFLSIECTQTADSAVCRCKLQDQYETYVMDYNLLRLEGEWLVDVAYEDNINFQEEEIIKALDSLRQLQQEGF